MKKNTRTQIVLRRVSYSSLPEKKSEEKRGGGERGGAAPGAAMMQV
jgi:hypothetical protein